MWADFEHAPDTHFYIKEVARLRNGLYVIPMKWVCVIDSGVETQCVDVCFVDYDPLVSE